ncbi:P-loop nucleotide/nucleoside kinase family protein [Flindersiella endophytica]
MTLLLIQLAGAPGSGKSTLARRLAGRFDATVLDTDVVKSALLAADVPWSLAGKAGYNVLFALAGDLLEQGRNAIVDSPSHYDVIPARGAAIAARHRAGYRFVECVCDDSAELRRRLTTRTPRPSQMPDLDRLPSGADVPSPAVRVGEHRWQTFGPPEGHLVVDSARPPDAVLADAVAYIESGSAPGIGD